LGQITLSAVSCPYTTLPALSHVRANKPEFEARRVSMGAQALPAAYF